MNNIIQFIRRYLTQIVFLLLEALCVVLIIAFNDYHRASFFSSANVVVGTFREMSKSVGSYFYLSEANKELMEQNGNLIEEIARLESRLAAYMDSADVNALNSRLRPDTADYRYMRARVIDITTNRSRNMLTLDKGKRDGVRQDMAVVCSQGVVGIVAAVSKHFSLVMPIINTSSHLSVKIKNTNHRGQLVWNGFSDNYANVVDVPEHASVEVGDTIVTSGASSFFPDGCRVGYVSEVKTDRNGGFYDIDVKLSVDFNAIYLVELIEDLRGEERELLQQTENNE